jgi:hypothetical protein
MSHGDLDPFGHTVSVRSRRAAVLLGVWGALAAALARFAPEADAKRKKRKKKIVVCHDGQTIKIPAKKKKQHLNHGDTLGTCDGPQLAECEPECDTGDVCDDGECRTCTVTCDGNGAACGAALQDALDAGNDVFVCPGRYVGNFTVSTQARVIGSGQGSDPASNTVLDADESGRVLDVATGVGFTLNRLHITGGDLDGNESGGGLRNAGTTTMTSCTVRQNSATFGGGIDNRSSLTLNSCEVVDNVANDSGGGIFQDQAHIVLRNCIVSGNRTLFIGGGGIASFFDSVAVILGSEISGNHAESVGGGIVNLSVTVFDKSSRVVGNAAEDEGGGIFNEPSIPDATVLLNGATVKENSAPQCINVSGC